MILYAFEKLFVIIECVIVGNAPTCSLRNKRVELKRYWLFSVPMSETKCIDKCDNSKKCLAWQYHVHLQLCRLTVKKG